MNKIFAYFNKLAPYNNRPWVIVIIASLLVCFLLGFFQPFGIGNLSLVSQLYVIVGFTLVTAICTTVVGYLFPYIFKKFYTQSNWTIGKSLLNQIFLILFIALGNFCFDWAITDREPDTFLPVLLSYLSVTFFIGIIPAFVSFFVVQNSALKRNLSEARLMNERLIKRLHNQTNVKQPETNVIVLTGNTKESISISPENILYLESSGNYVKVNYLLNNIVKQKQLRATISQIEQQLEQCPYILRCHRAYMVNISFVSNVAGNSQGLQLSLRYAKEEIPVSRSYIKIMKDKL